MKTGIIVLGHGSRRTGANEEFECIVDLLKQERDDLDVLGAYVEFAQPSLCDAVQLFAEQGRNKIVIVPLFLTVGNHLHKHIPEKIERMKVEYPEIEFVQTKHLGADPLVVKIIENRIRLAE